MPRARAIKPDFFRNQRITSVSYGARLLYLGLVVLCDSAGVSPAYPRRLLMELFPCQGVVEPDIGRWLHELEAVGLICCYEDDDVPYAFITGFAEHQKDKYPSIKYPQPPKALLANRKRQKDLFTPIASADSRSAPTALLYHDSTQLNSIGISDSQEKTPSAAVNGNGKSKRGTRLPDDFEVPLDWRADGKAFLDKHSIRGVLVDLEAERFANYWISATGKGATKADWHRAFLNWLARASEMTRGATRGNPELKFDHL